MLINDELEKGKYNVTIVAFASYKIMSEDNITEEISLEWNKNNIFFCKVKCKKLLSLFKFKKKILFNLIENSNSFIFLQIEIYFITLKNIL